MLHSQALVSQLDSEIGLNPRHIDESLSIQMNLTYITILIFLHVLRKIIALSALRQSGLIIITISIGLSGLAFFIY